MTQMDLCSGWTIREAVGHRDIPVKVPGSVLGALLEAHLIEDPFAAENEYAARQLCESDYLFERSFSLDAELLKHEHVDVVFEGLDTVAEVRLNGQVILKADNMHRTWRADIRPWARAGENHLSILFSSPIAYVRKAAEENPDVTCCPTGCMPGNGFLRKAHYMFGWDWGPQLPDAGIWRPCRIEAYDTLRIEGVEILQHHGAEGVTLSVSVETAPACPQAVRVHLTAPDGAESVYRQEGAALEFSIPNPQLWYPNGWGEQPLYQLEISCEDERGQTLDCARRRIGLRTVEISTEADQWGSEFCFKVNGSRLFAMGADYIPEDNLLGRTCKERTRALLADCARANFNCIRVWGGGYYPEDWFFDLCDEMGLMVWMDLMFACNVYKMTPGFEANIVAETRDNIRRIRHHASLGLICGNNEMEVAWCEWSNVVNHSPALRADYLKQFEFVLKDECRRLAPQVPYWSSSPSSGGCFDDPNSYDRGDVHCWDVWHGMLPFEAYQEKYPRFCSEFGFESFPNLKTVKAFAEEKDWNIFSRVMESHQKCPGGNGKIMYFLAQNYQYPLTFEDTLYASQVLQAEAMRAGVEHWRRHRGRCMGAIYWQLNDCWPVASWASIDSLGRWKALHYAAKRFFAPVLVSMQLTGETAKISIANDRLTDFSGRLCWQVIDAHGTALHQTQENVTVPALSAQWAAEQDLQRFLDERQLHPEDHLAIVAALYDGEGQLVSRSCELLSRPKFFAFEKPRFTWRIAQRGADCDIELTSSCFAWSVMLDVRDADCLFSDNCFFVLPGEPLHLKAYGISREKLEKGLFVQSISDLNHAR